jgi:hypothetical protein
MKTSIAAMFGVWFVVGTATSASTSVFEIYAGQTASPASSSSLEQVLTLTLHCRNVMRFLCDHEPLVSHRWTDSQLSLREYDDDDIVEAYRRPFPDSQRAKLAAFQSLVNDSRFFVTIPSRGYNPVEAICRYVYDRREHGGDYANGGFSTYVTKTYPKLRGCLQKNPNWQRILREFAENNQSLRCVYSNYMSDGACSDDSRTIILKREFALPIIAVAVSVFGPDVILPWLSQAIYPAPTAEVSTFLQDLSDQQPSCLLL